MKPSQSRYNCVAPIARSFVANDIEIRPPASRFSGGRTPTSVNEADIRCGSENRWKGLEVAMRQCGDRFCIFGWADTEVDDSSQPGAAPQPLARICGSCPSPRG